MPTDVTVDRHFLYPKTKGDFMPTKAQTYADLAELTAEQLMIYEQNGWSRELSPLNTKLYLKSSIALIKESISSRVNAGGTLMGSFFSGTRL